MEHKSESEARRMSRKEKQREEKIAEIRQQDPGFIPPVHEPRARKSNTSFWVWIGVGVLIVLLLIWLSVAMFTGDTDVNLITPFPWV